MALASEKVAGLMTEEWEEVPENPEEVDGIPEMTSILDSKMMTSWEAGVEEPALETGDHQVPQWEVVALVASEMGLPFVDLPWTSESQQKRKEHSDPDFSSNLEQLLLPSIK